MRQPREDELLDSPVPAVAGVDIALRIGGDDMQAEELAGIGTDMAEHRSGNFLQRLPVQHPYPLLMAFTDIEEALVFVA